MWRMARARRACRGRGRKRRVMVQDHNSLRLCRCLRTPSEDGPGEHHGAHPTPTHTAPELRPFELQDLEARHQLYMSRRRRKGMVVESVGQW
jgi:hypothetical protein